MHIEANVSTSCACEDEGDGLSAAVEASSTTPVGSQGPGLSPQGLAESNGAGGVAQPFGQVSAEERATRLKKLVREDSGAEVGAVWNSEELCQEMIKAAGEENWISGDLNDPATVEYKLRQLKSISWRRKSCTMNITTLPGACLLRSMSDIAFSSLSRRCKWRRSTMICQCS